MRLEYVVVSLILMIVVLVVIITLLSGAVPSLEPVFGMFRSR